MKKIKIFSPDIMFGDHIKGCWCDNIRTIQDKIPIHKELKEKSVYALDIEPMDSKDWFAFSLPIKKDWSNIDFKSLGKCKLKFETVGCVPINIDVSIVNEKNVKVFTESIKATNIDEWNKIEIDIDLDCDGRLLLFTGNVNLFNFIIKDIIIE